MAGMTRGERLDWVVEQLAEGNTTVGSLATLAGVRRSTIQRSMDRLKAKGEVEEAGSIQGRTGRPQIVWGLK
jgi:predicted ArsR family transcriptional regulator